MNPAAQVAAAVLALSFADALAEATSYSSYVELRAYTVHEAQRDRFLEFFEEHYLESQEAVGMRVWGQFRDLDEPGLFVWLRGYRTMEERLDGLTAFYGGPVWEETGGEAVSMLAERAWHIHFLEPVGTEAIFPDDARRPSLVSELPDDWSAGVVVAEVLESGGDPAAAAGRIRDAVVPAFENGGGAILGLFRASAEENNFPMLSVLDEDVVVLFASFEDRAAYERAAAGTSDVERLETFVLEPGNRSRLRHRP